MALDLDGLCHVLYCECKAGKVAMARDQDIRRGLNQMRDTGVVQRGNSDFGGYEWATVSPADYIAGRWWAEMREVVNDG
jgi:hypothetical protein